MPLDKAREKIDRIDAEIVRLLDERARVGREIGDIKRRLGLPFHNPGRELAVLRRLRGMSDGSMPGEAIDSVYRAVMAATLALQKPDRDEAEARPARACRADHARPGKLDAAAAVIENAEAAQGLYRMRIQAPDLAGVFAPGQFFQLRLGGAGSAFFLRRPFAPAEYLDDGFAFYYALAGNGTREMSRMRPGTMVNVLAPLGNAYTPLPSGGNALLAGGGCGAPSLAPLAKRLREEGVRVTAILGARTASGLPDFETLFHGVDRLIIATDDGSRGCRGTIVDAYRSERKDIGSFDRLCACGPLPMLRAAAALARENGADCEVSLEERMACGFGACMGCAVPVLAEGGGPAYRRVCHDGPVFNSRTLDWNAMR